MYSTSDQEMESSHERSEEEYDLVMRSNKKVRAGDLHIQQELFFKKNFGFEADQEDEISDEDEDDGLDENDFDCHTIRVSKKEKSKDPIALDNGFFLAKCPQRKIMILRNLDDFAHPNFDSSQNQPPQMHVGVGMGKITMYANRIIF